MNKTLWNLLKENWTIIVVVGQFLITIYALQSGFDDHEERIKELEVSKTSDALTISQINSRLASIETSILFIKDALK